MRIGLKDEKILESYSVEHIEDQVILINFKSAEIRDCYPLYPIAIYTDHASEIMWIESLWTEKEWTHSAISKPEVVGERRIHMEEKGEHRAKFGGDDLSFQEDEVDILFDKKSNILLIKIGENKAQQYYEIAEDVIAGVIDDKLLVELYFLNFKSHYQLS